MKNPTWKMNDNPESHLKYADLLKDEWNWTEFSMMFRRQFCCGNIDDVWSVFCMNKEVRIYKYR